MSGLSLEARNLKRTFPKTGFSLDVEHVEAPAGHTLALLGPSGSGKTTLLNLLGLLEKPDSGEVLIGGRVVTKSDRDARLQMAAVFQRPYLFRGTVQDNVAYGLKSRGASAAKRRAAVDDSLARVGLSGYADRSAAGLSGGEAQRVSLARALAIEPSVLLLDEPLSSLDPLLKQQLTREFAEIIGQTGATVVWVTHDQDEALSVADHVAIMNAGRVVASGPAEDAMGLPADDWTAAFLGMAQAHPAQVMSVHEGVVELRTPEGATIFASGFAEQGVHVLFAVRPEDVLLFEAGADLPPTTARNRLAALVESTEPHGATVTATLDAGGVRLAASVSRAAARELGIAPDVEVLAVFKATAVRWRFLADEERR